MRRRPSSRLLVVDPADRVLLFRFIHRRGALAGRDFWATPGGGLEDGESFEQAAVRELFEETGVRVAAVGEPVARREFPMRMPDGEMVLADERLYLIRAESSTLSRAGWTDEEHETMQEYRWWSVEQLEVTGDTVYPEDLAAILGRARGAEEPA
ncbi:MAG: NUDIX domain-containing protein [Thalassobaculum sp.]|uniref:NUDIX hydrolase n=1 Tax=Thalassobaculum sp. TaxID=2022740 RepID=UPI0032F06E55